MRRKSIADTIKGVDKLFITEEENPIINNEVAIESASNTIIKSETIIESNPNYNPIINPIIEKVKYTDSRTQRAFYYDKKLIKDFDKHYPKSRYNKSEIMNELLRKFLVENGKI